MAHTNRFIINSDYLSLARVGNYSENVIIDSVFAKYRNQYERIVKYIDVPAPKRAIARMSISYTPPDWGFGTKETTTPASVVTLGGRIPDQQGRPVQVTWYIFTSREDNKIKVQAYVGKNSGVEGVEQQIPSLPIKINISYFYPPNIK